jgi:hypothetical protein
MGVQTLKRSFFLATVFSAVLVIVLPFAGGSGPSVADATQVSGASILGTVTSAESTVRSPALVTASVSAPAVVASIEHVAQKPVPPPPPPVVVAPSGARRGGSSGAAVAAAPAARRAQLAAVGQSCPANVGGSTGGANGATVDGVIGTTTAADLSGFAGQMNAIRVANCLPPIPLANYRYNSCLEARLIWIAADPSPDVNSAWGHKGTVRSDNAPEPADCDGNLAGGAGNTGAVVAQKWWDSLDHRDSLYRPTYVGSTANVCIQFAMVHGGLPNDGYSFTRAAAIWVSC